MPSRLLRLFLPLGATLLWSGCATHRPVSAPLSVAHAPAAPPARAVFVWIPLSDANAGAWIKLFDTHPNLRMAVAVSPRFKHLAQDPLVRLRLQTLQKAGRLELALQLPNAPFLPLLVDSNAAKDSLPRQSALPQPAFAYPDDVIQMVAGAKAEFFRQWHVLPKGLALPYGAASPALLGLLEKQGFTWVAAALQAPAVDGVYKVGAMSVWDATPAGQASRTRSFVWDERTMKSRTALMEWLQNVSRAGGAVVLPSDSSAPGIPLTPAVRWARRTWTTPDWSPWIGTPAKNAGWESLRRTRETLETYKNSGQASIKRLDMAFEEMYTSENSNYLLALDNPKVSPQTAEERTHEFEATLTTVYRIIGRTPPDDLFRSAQVQPTNAPAGSAGSETLPDGTEHIWFDDPAGDDRGDGHLEPAGKLAAGRLDLRKFEISADTADVRFTITMGGAADATLGSAGVPGPLIDVYIDLNHAPNVGTLPLLPGRHLNAAAHDAWEYAITLGGDHAVVERTQNATGYEQAGVFPLAVHGNRIEFSLPRTLLRGSPQHWGYQVLVMAVDPASTAENLQPSVPVTSGSAVAPVYDLLDPPSATQASLLSPNEEGKVPELPFVRPRGAEAE